MTRDPTRLNAPDHKAIYFGCLGGVGHFYYDIAGRSLGIRSKELGLPWERVDGALTPGKRDRRGRLDYHAQDATHQGEAAIHHKDGWTALAIHDFTVDSRPGSNSVFFFRAPGLDDTECLFSIGQFFPKIGERIGRIVVLDVVDDDLIEGGSSGS